MATAKVKVYPYVCLDLKGELKYVAVNAFPGEDKADVKYGSIFIYLPAIELDVNTPTDDQLRLGAAALIDKQMLDERAAFHAQQTLMQSVKNDLLRLEHAEVLDAADAIPQMPERDLSRCVHCEKPKSKHSDVNGVFFCTEDHDDSTTFEEDDIPF